MSTSYPTQGPRTWEGAYTDPTLLPGVSAAEVNLHVGDVAYLLPTGFSLAIPVYCMNPAFPAVWIPGYMPKDYLFAGSTGPGATLYAADASGTSVATIALQYPVNSGLYLDKLRVYASVNTLNQACAFTVYKNGGATGITLSIPAGTTGLFSDTAHNASFTGGVDRFDIQTSVPAGTGILRFAAMISGFQTELIL